MKFEDTEKIEEKVYSDISKLKYVLIKGVGEVENCPTAIEVKDEYGNKSLIDTLGDLGC
jgi:hypothetical protein